MVLEISIIIAAILLVVFLKKKREKETSSNIVFKPIGANGLDEIDMSIVSLINNYRVHKQKFALFLEYEHCALAERRLQFMIDNNKFSHEMWFKHSKDIRRKGIVSCAENLGKAYYNEITCFRAWKNSSSHNDNMLLDKWKYIGVAQRTHPTLGTLYCAVFGTDEN